MTKDTEALREALEPFAAFAVDNAPDDLVITAGSRMARRQLTMGDCKCAKAALATGAENAQVEQFAENAKNPADPVGLREPLREAAFRIANMHMLAVGASLSTFDERVRYVQRLADEIAALATPASDVAPVGEVTVSLPVYEAAVKGRQDFRKAYRELRDLLTHREWEAVAAIGEGQELSTGAVLRQAVRLYQLHHVRLKAGETFSWSGDQQRAKDFAGPLYVHPPLAQSVDPDTASYARTLIAHALHGEANAISRAIVDDDDRVFIEMYDVEALLVGVLQSVDPVAGEAVERPEDDTLLEHLPEDIQGAKRCGIQRSAWMTSWFVPWSPRNDNENAEGPWSDWVALANRILEADAKALAALKGPAA